MTLDFRKVIGLFYDTTTTTTSTKTLFSTISSLSTTATTTASLSETSSSPDAPTSVTSAISASSTKAPISIALITATNTAYSRLNSLSADAPTSVTSTKVPTQLALTTSRTKTSYTHVPNSVSSTRSATSASSTKAPTTLALIKATNTAYPRPKTSLPVAPTWESSTKAPTSSLSTTDATMASSRETSSSPDAPNSVTSTKVPTQLALTTSRTKTSSTHVPNSESSTKADTSIALITTTTASSIATSSLPDAPTLTTVQTMSLYTKALNSLSSTAASTSPSPTLMTSMTPSTRSTKKKFKLAPFTATSKIAKTLQTEIKNKTTTILKNKGFFYENNNLNTKSDGPVSNFIVTTSAPFLSSSPSYPSKPFTSFDSADNFVSSYFLTLIVIMGSFFIYFFLRNFFFKKKKGFFSQNLNSNVNKEESSQPFKIDKMSETSVMTDDLDSIFVYERNKISHSKSLINTKLVLDSIITDDRTEESSKILENFRNQNCLQNRSKKDRFLKYRQSFADIEKDNSFFLQPIEVQIANYFPIFESISEISQDSISKQRKDNENDLEELVLNLNLLTLSDSNHNSEDKNSIYKTPKVSFLNEKKNDTIKLSSDSDKTERSITMSSSSVSFCLNIFDSFEKTAVIQEPIHVNNATITLSSDESVSEESHISVIDSHSDSGSSESIEN